MKFKTKCSLSIISLITLALFACKKTNSSSSPSVTATIGNASFQSVVATGIYFQGSRSIEIHAATLTGADSNQLILALYTKDIVLNKPIASDTSGLGLFWLTAAGTPYDAITGNGRATATVTSWDSSAHHISGIFSGTVKNINDASDSVNFSNGRFSTTYSLQQ